MTVRPLGLASLSRVPRPVSDYTLDASIRLGKVRRRLSLRIPPFGTVSLSCVNVTTPLPPQDQDVVWTLTHHSGDGRSGFLLATSLTCLRVVAVILGLPAPQIYRRLGTAERGIVTSTIATILRATVRDATVALDHPRWLANGLVRLTIEMDLNGFVEFAQLDLPPDWIPRDASSLVADLTARGLDIGLAIELGRTDLPASHWSAARPGDAVVFDVPWEPMPDRGRVIQITCGSFAAAGKLSPDGTVTLLSDFQESRARSTPSLANKLKERERMPSGDELSASLAVLAAAPVEVVAEVARIVLRADEVAALRPGSVLPIGILSPTAVELRVADRTWARGELVDVEGQLGVRLTTVTPTAGGMSRPNPDEEETAR